MEEILLMTVLNSLIKTANKAEATFCNTGHKGMIPHWAL
jgi:hypothetical protein